MDPTQIKSKDARGHFMFHQTSSVRVAEITRWLRVVSADTGGLIPQHRKNVALTWTNHWLACHQEGRGEGRAHQAGHSHTFRHLFGMYGFNRGPAPAPVIRALLLLELNQVRFGVLSPSSALQSAGPGAISYRRDA